MSENNWPRFQTRFSTALRCSFSPLFVLHNIYDMKTTVREKKRKHINFRDGPLPVYYQDEFTIKKDMQHQSLYNNTVMGRSNTYRSQLLGVKHYLLAHRVKTRRFSPIRLYILHTWLLHIENDRVNFN